MVSKKIKTLVESPASGVIRKMFEEGAALKKQFGEDAVYDFSLGNPDLDPPKEFFDALVKCAGDKTHGTHGYMPNAGYNFARAAMAEKTSIEQGVQVALENVVMSVGAAGAINVTLKSLLNDGDEVIVVCPYFVEYDHYITNHGGSIVRVQSAPDFSLDSEAIAAALNEKTCAIIINSPNNPTGRIYSEKEIIALADVLRAHGKKCGRLPYIIADEPYRAITYDGKSVAPIFTHYENTVVVTSFAKNLSVPGERIGYLAVNPACAEWRDFIAAAIFTTRTLGYVNAPAIMQKAIADSWNAPCDYSSYATRLEKMKYVLDNAGLKYAEPEGAFYLFVKVPDGWHDDDLAFTSHLKKYHILCAPGSGFGGKGWFRIAYCCPEKSIVNSCEAFYKAVHDSK